MKHFSQDIISNVKSLNTNIKLAAIDKKDAENKNLHLAYLVSELAEDDKEEINKVCEENSSLLNSLE